MYNYYNFIRTLSKLPEKSLLKKATRHLRKEGDYITKDFPNGTKVTYLRGENISGHTFGEKKYKLFKEVTQPDNTRYVTNANRYGDQLFIDQVYYIKPNDIIPDYIPWADKVYQMNPGYSKHAEEVAFKSNNIKVGYLKDLLRKKLSPKNNTGKTHYQSSNYNQKAYSEQNSYYKKDTHSEQNYKSYTNSNSKANNTTSDTGKKITKEAFVKYMSGRLRNHNLISVKDLKGAEVRNLSRLFGISVDELTHLNKKTQRNLVLKFHPDRNNDPLSQEIFVILNKLKLEM